MQLLYRINRTGTTVLVATHDSTMVDRMRRRVLELDKGRIVRDEIGGRYAQTDMSTAEFGALLREPAPEPRARRARRRLRRLRRRVPRLMKIGFFLREALRSLTRNAVPSFAALASVLVTLLVLGVFIPIVQATTGAANEVRGRVLVNVYLKADATQADVARVQGRPRGQPGRREGRVRQQGAGAARGEGQEPRGLPAARLQPAAGHLPRHAEGPGRDEAR